MKKLWQEEDTHSYWEYKGSDHGKDVQGIFKNRGPEYISYGSVWWFSYIGMISRFGPKHDTTSEAILQEKAIAYLSAVHIYQL